MTADLGREADFGHARGAQSNPQFSRRACLAVWVGMAGVGWGLVGLATHLMT